MIDPLFDRRSRRRNRKRSLSRDTHTSLACSAFALMQQGIRHASKVWRAVETFPLLSLSPPSLRSFVFYFVSRFYSALLNQRQPMDHSMSLFCIFLSFPFCTHTHTPLTLTFALSLRRPTDSGDPVSSKSSICSKRLTEMEF